ncbi:hypothetical protein LXM94_07855 [Rhizobium sp. TRM95111]|uniref:hypothetical protein n=1 Tax=Rhizobium alarense TaxID=2846851 RepID=UPI001F206CCE|nr:hypothetical protein [Rhizobium alarense]MCF3639881.1 hypothetical protein [Rhizobium alarense]
MLRLLLAFLTAGCILLPAGAVAQPTCTARPRVVEVNDAGCPITGVRVRILCRNVLLRHFCKARTAAPPDTDTDSSEPAGAHDG